MEPCTCTIACIPQGITEEQVCRLIDDWKNQAALEVDEAVFGLAIVDEEGKRIDPREVST